MRKIITTLIDYILSLNSRKLILVAVILIVISYVNSLSVNFIWDDYPAVVSNASIRNLSLKNIDKPMYQDDSPNAAKAPVYYRPLQVLSYASDYRLWKLNPFGYHITNIILHILNAILLYSLLLLLFKDSIFAFLGSALFGTNPIFASSVTYISGRAEILSVFFLLLMIISFIKSIKDSKLNIFFYGLSLVFYFFLLLSKEIGAVGILFLLMIDKLIFKYSIKKLKNLIYSPFVLVFLFWQYLKPSAISGFHAAIANLGGVMLGFLTLLKGMIVYTFLSVTPFRLRMGRSIAVVTGLQDIWAYISLIFLIIAVLLFVRGLRKNKLAVFGLFWFYLPLSFLIFFNYLFAKRDNQILLPEHNLYFCYIGVVVFVFSTIAPLKLKMKTKKYLIAVFLCFVIFYIGSTISENHTWHDEVKFFERNVNYNKDSAFNFVGYSNLGFAYERAKELKLAEENFKLAARRSGKNPYFYNMLASFYIRNGNFDSALKTLISSKELDMNFDNTYLLLGIVKVNRNDYVAARYNFEKALSINPADVVARRYLDTLKSSKDIN